MAVGDGYLDSGIIKRAGAWAPGGWISNCAITLASNVFTFCGFDGTALSSSNKAQFTIPSGTAGQDSEVTIAANKTVEDDGHASTTLNAGLMGTTASVAWGSEMPWFIYVYEDPNAAGSGLICFSRNPCMNQTPASGNNIGFKGDDPATSAQDNIFVLESSLTASEHVNAPCLLIGAIGVTRGSGATDDWTLELNSYNGLGPYALAKTFAAQYTYVVGQGGAIESTFLDVDGGDASADVPKWATTQGRYGWWIHPDGTFTIDFSTVNESNCTNGDVGAALKLSLPFIPTHHVANSHFVNGEITTGNVDFPGILTINNSSTQSGLREELNVILANEFTNAADELTCMYTLNAFGTSA